MNILTDDEIEQEAMMRAGIQPHPTGLSFAPTNAQCLRYEAEVHNMRIQRDILIQNKSSGYEPDNERSSQRRRYVDSRGILHPSSNTTISEVDKEALELLEIRRELNAKKKREQEQGQEQEKYIREQLVLEPAFVWKTGASTQGSITASASNGYGNGTYSKEWVPSPSGKHSIKEMMESYKELEAYRSTASQIVKEYVDKIVIELWKIPDEKVIDLDNQQREGRGDPFYMLSNRDCKMIPDGNYNPYSEHYNYWKTLIIEKLFYSYYSKESTKWTNYYEIFIKRYRQTTH